MVGGGVVVGLFLFVLVGVEGVVLVLELVPFERFV